MVWFSKAICGVAIGLMLAQPASARADVPNPYEEVLALNPGVAQTELEKDIASIADETGRTEESVLAEMILGARSAVGDADAPVVTQLTARNGTLGNDGLGYQVVTGCSTAGNYTYSHARNLGVNHGHNAIFVSSCGLVHAPGAGKTVSRASSTFKFYSHPSYVAPIRSPKNVTSSQRSKAAAFAVSKIGYPYKDKFYANRIVNSDYYNCSQLVWASWRSVGPDISGHTRSGIYPADLRSSAVSTFIKNMTRV